MTLALSGCAGEEKDTGFSNENSKESIAVVAENINESDYKKILTDDFENYKLEVEQIIELEDEIMVEYSSVTGENYSDDEETYNHLLDVIIPKYLIFIDKLEAIRPETKEIRALHEIYIDASNTMFEGMTIMPSALENGDYEMITKANEKLANGRAKGREFGNEVDRLNELIYE